MHIFMQTDNREQMPERERVEREIPQGVEATEFAEEKAKAAVPEIKTALNQFGEITPLLNQLSKALDKKAPDSRNEGRIQNLLWQLDQSAPMRAIRAIWNRVPTFVQRGLYHTPSAPLFFLQPLVENGFLDINGMDAGKTTEKSIDLNANIQKIVLAVVMLIEPELKVLQPLVAVCDKLKRHQTQYRLWLRSRRAQEEATNKEKDAHRKKSKDKKLERTN